MLSEKKAEVEEEKGKKEVVREGGSCRKVEAEKRFKKRCDRGEES